MAEVLRARLAQSATRSELLVFCRYKSLLCIKMTPCLIKNERFQVVPGKAFTTVIGNANSPEKGNIMRALLFVFALFVSGPLFAQPSECRGKQSFDLGNGTTGCLLDIRETSITKSVIRDDGQSRSNARGAALIEVAMFGTFSKKWSISTPRMKAVCSLFADQTKATLAGKSVKQIVVVMRWPREPGTVVLPNRVLRGKGYQTHAAFMSSSC